MNDPILALCPARDGGECCCEPLTAEERERLRNGIRITDHAIVMRLLRERDQLERERDHERDKHEYERVRAEAFLDEAGIPSMSDNIGIPWSIPGRVNLLRQERDDARADRDRLRALAIEFADHCEDCGWRNLGGELRRRALAAER